MDINMELFQRFIIFFDKKTSSGTVKNKIISNKELVKELHQLIIRNLRRGKYIHPS